MFLLSKFTEMCPVGEAIMHSETDMKPTGAFIDYANALDNGSLIQTFNNHTKNVAGTRKFTKQDIAAC
jgi:hypothetical protein